MLRKRHPEIVPITKVAIIVLNWNGWGDTVECLKSLYRITYPNYNVIVVDNGSEDESVKRYLCKKMTNFNLVIK